MWCLLLLSKLTPSHSNGVHASQGCKDLSHRAQSASCPEWCEWRTLSEDSKSHCCTVWIFIKYNGAVSMPMNIIIFHSESLQPLIITDLTWAKSSSRLYHTVYSHWLIGISWFTKNFTWLASPSKFPSFFMWKILSGNEVRPRCGMKKRPVLI